jgi:putative ABC transport system permease protein
MLARAWRLLRLAFRNLTRNRRRTLLSLLAISIGIGALISFRGFVNGQRRMVLSGVVEGTLGAVQVHRKGYVASVQGLPLHLDIPDSPELRARIAAVEGVVAVAPRIVFGAMLSTPDQGDQPGKSTFLVATAIEPGPERRVTPAGFQWIQTGRPFDRADAAEMVLNSSLAESLSLRPLGRDEPPPPLEQMPAILASDRDGALNGENVVLVGEQVSARPGDRRVGLVPLRTAQRLLRMEGRVTEYAVAVRSLEEAPAVRDRLAAALGPELEVHTWQELMPFLLELASAQDFLLSMVASIFLVIVLLGIVNSMLMNVLERVREIGTMLAVGMRRRQVVALLVLEGTALGIGGGALGALLGVSLTAFLHWRGIQLTAPGAAVENTLRPYVTPAAVLLAMLAAVVGASLAALWPAVRASRLRPVDALRSV